jgi:hypothetical protein
MKNKAIIFLILGFTLMPSLIGVQAAAGGLLEGIQDSCYENGNCTFCDIVKVGTNIFNFLRNKIAFPVAVLFIIYGGILMVSSRGSKSQIENGKKILFAALIGFAIVLSVSLILNSVLILLSGEKGGWKAFVNGSIGCGIESDLKAK